MSRPHWHRLPFAGADPAEMFFYISSLRIRPVNHDNVNRTVVHKARTLRSSVEATTVPSWLKAHSAAAPSSRAGRLHLTEPGRGLSNSLLLRCTAQSQECVGFPGIQTHRLTP